MTIFQSIFDWSSIPQDFIDSTFATLSEQAKTSTSSREFLQVYWQGIIPGLGGISHFYSSNCLFIFFISILEETGYMSRVVFLMDRGLDGLA